MGWVRTPPPGPPGIPLSMTSVTPGRTRYLLYSKVSHQVQATRRSPQTAWLSGVLISFAALPLLPEKVRIGVVPVKKYPHRADTGSPPLFSRFWDSPSPCLLYTSPSPRDGLLSRMPS